MQRGGLAAEILTAGVLCQRKKSKKERADFLLNHLFQNLPEFNSY